MASRGKKKTTMAKFAREAKLRERRFEKDARKAARKLEAAQDEQLEPAPAVPAEPQARPA